MFRFYLENHVIHASLLMKFILLYFDLNLLVKDDDHDILTNFVAVCIGHCTVNTFA